MQELVFYINDEVIETVRSNGLCCTALNLVLARPPYNATVLGG